MGQAQSDKNSGSSEIPTTTTKTNSPPDSDGNDTSSSPMGSLLAGLVSLLRFLLCVFCISIEMMLY